MNRNEFDAARRELRQEAAEDLDRRSRFDSSAGGQLLATSRTLSAYVSNLSFQASSYDLRSFLRANGVRSITTCELRPHGRGKATVTVAISDDMTTLLKLDGKMFRGRDMRVQPDRRVSAVHKRWDGRSLHVGCVPEGSDEFRSFWTTSSSVAFEMTDNGAFPLAVEFGKYHRVEFRVRDVVRCCLQSNRRTGGTTLWLRLRRPPLCYRKPEHESDDMPFSVKNLLELDEWVRSTDPSGTHVFGQCFDYALELTAAPQDIVGSLRRYGVKITDFSFYKPIPSALTPSKMLGEWSRGDDSLFGAVPWPVRYALNVLVVLRKLDFSDGAFASLVAHKCATSVTPPADLGHHIVSLRTFPRNSVRDKLIKVLEASGTDPLPPAPPGHMVRRVLVTPLRVVPEAPEPDQSNRVLRKFDFVVDRFLRATFVDENFASIFHVNRSEHVFGRIRRLLRDGLQVAGDTFHFLAYSNSQLRSHSCWFFKSATTGEAGIPTVAEIRQSLGSFQAIPVAGRRGARLGQAFSSTTPTLDVPARRVMVQPDISRNGHTFSDGVGVISPALADQVAQMLHVDCVPSAFQIRYGGAKGVVTVMPTPTALVLRKSMVKFDSNDTGLEVCSVATARPFYLNRQVVTLLSCLGVPDKSFVALQDVMMETLATCVATTADAIVLFANHASTAPPLAMMRAGCTLADPFVFQWTQSLRSRLSLDLQLKTRILVPRAVCLMGVLDETHTLPEGYVFFETRSNVFQVPPVDATLAIGRSPCLHPGDIRLMRRGHVPALSHLYDVLVFSSKGSRPDPNKMSGGDLDGDIYFVIWDESLLPPHEYPPMTYDPPTSSSLAPTTNSINKDAIGDFFVDFMLNDSLGRISIAHLVFADLLEQGAKSPECLKLAEQASTAVDFAKTGKCVTGLIKSAGVYPDFMENPTKHSYRSEKVLGQLYRRAKAAHSPDVAGGRWTVDPNLVVPGHEKYMADADDQCFAYSTELWDVASKYQVETEIELVSGNVRRMSRQVCRNQGVKSTDDVLERLQRVVRHIQAKYEAIFWAEFENDRGDPRAVEKASAWYYTAYTYEWEGGDPPYLSFGWLALNPMCQLLERAKKGP